MKRSTLLLLAALALLALGCTQQTDTVDTRHIDANSLPKDINTGAYMVECSRFFPKLGGLSGNIKVFKHNGYVRNDIATVHFTTSLNLNNRVLRFYRWRQSSSGEVYGDQTPLRFDAVINGQTYTGFTELTSLSSSNITLNQITFDVHGTDIGYHAVQASIYNNQTGNIEMYSDGLIPMFYAHPRDYKRTHQRQNELNAIHPYMSEINSSLSDIEFSRRSMVDFCF